MVLILVLLLLAACTPAPKQQARVTPPPLPRFESHFVQPMAMPVSAQIQQASPSDPVGIAIVEARLRFERGEELLKEGFLKQAKEEFDGAIDALLETGETHPKNARLERELRELVARVHALELTALRDGDGFTDQKQEKAAIDDLKNIETFPAPVDPNLRKELEAGIRDGSHDLPIEINDRVLSFLNYYQNGRGRGTIEVGLERIGKYRPMIESILKQEGVPLDLVYLAQAESAFLPRATSRAKAKGMWQFIPSRGREYGLRQTWWIDERSDSENATRAAARYLKDLYEEFNDWYLAMAAYNAGPGRVARAMQRTGADNFWTLANKRALPRETINYVPTILALTIIGSNPEKYGFSVVPAEPVGTERMSVDKPTDLRVIAEAINLPVEQLRELNPHVLRWTTPPEDPEFQLILPRGYGEKFTETVASLPESKRVLFREHVVRKGDTLGALARRYGSSVAELQQANNLKKKSVLRIGQSLIIPISGVAPAPTQQVASSWYTIRKGDTLSVLSSRFNVSVEQLKRWNNLSDTRLSVGQKLLIAAKGN